MKGRKLYYSYRTTDSVCICEIVSVIFLVIEDLIGGGYLRTSEEVQSTAQVTSINRRHSEPATGRSQRKGEPFQLGLL